MELTQAHIKQWAMNTGLTDNEYNFYYSNVLAKQDKSPQLQQLLAIIRKEYVK